MKSIRRIARQIFRTLAELRRRALGVAWVVWLLATVISTLAGEPSESRAAKPNVVFIAIDDMNNWLGCLGGHPLVKTPNIDRLGARGAVFLNAHCQVPLCNPSRTSLLTGLRPSTSGVYALDPWFRTSPPLKEWVSLPQYFARHGYRTLTTGKIWHDAYPPVKERTNGFEFTVWGPHGGFRPLPKEKFVRTPDNMALMDWGIFPERDEDCFDYDVATWAVDQLRQLPQGEPFFLCVGIRHPHVPCYAPKPWFDLYPDDASVLPPVLPGDRDDTPPFSWFLHWKLPEPRLAWLQANNQWQPLARAYLASVSFADAQIGRVLKALDASAHASNTVVVIWGDNGWHLGEKAISGKNSLWDPSTRVPLIFAGPGVRPGGRCGKPAELLDIYPTLIDLCGLPKKGDLEGHSLRPQLRDATTPRPWPAITTHGANNHAIRTEQWRYIRYANGSEELYNMQTDPHEWTNLTARPAYADTKRELSQWLPKLNTPPVPGSVTRLVELRDGVPWWEGKPIREGGNSQ